MFLGCITAVTVVLFVISLAALQRSPGYRSILLSLALGLFSLKNIVVTYFYLADDLPDIHPLMFADILVTGAILLRLLITGTVDSALEEEKELVEKEEVLKEEDIVEKEEDIVKKEENKEVVVEKEEINERVAEIEENEEVVAEIEENEEVVAEKEENKEVVAEKEENKEVVAEKEENKEKVAVIEDNKEGTEKSGEIPEKEMTGGGPELTGDGNGSEQVNEERSQRTTEEPPGV